MSHDERQAAGTARAPRPGGPPEASAHAQAVLWVVTLSSFFVPFMSSATNVALPRIALELGIDAPHLSWVNTSFMLASAALLLPLGRVADLRRRRPLFVGGLFVFAFVTALVTFAPSEPWLLGLRAVQGLVGAVPLAVSMPLLIAAWPPEKRGRAVGINIAGVYTGLSVGPVVGGLLTQVFGWRSIFAVTAAFSLAVAGFAAARLPPDRPPESHGRFDLAGSLLYALALCALMLGLARLPATVGVGLLVGSLVAAVGFALWELRTASPLLDIRLFGKNSVFLFSNLAALVNYCATAAVGFLLALYLQRIKGLDPRGTGLVLVVQPALMAILSAPAGRLSERIEPRLLATAGMTLTMVGLLILAGIGATTPTWVVVCALAILGIAFALFSSPNTNAVMSAVERRHLGIASATLGTMRGIGQMLSLGLCGLIFALTVGFVGIHDAALPDFLHAVRAAFVLFAVLCFCGIFASLARGRVHSVRTSG